MHLVDIVAGRISILQCAPSSGNRLDLCNVHLTPYLVAASQHTLIRRLQQHVAPLDEALTIIVGDLSIFTSGEGCLNITTGHMDSTNEPPAHMFNDLFPAFVEYLKASPVPFRIDESVRRLAQLARLDHNS